MKINGKISYKELENLVYIVKKKLENQFLKKIYHYKSGYSDWTKD